MALKAFGTKRCPLEGAMMRTLVSCKLTVKGYSKRMRIEETVGYEFM